MTAIVGIAALVTTASMASADTYVSMTTGSPTLLAKGVGATVPVAINCATGFYPFTYGYGDGVTIEQAVNKTSTTVATASRPNVTCDGADQQFTVYALVTAPSAPLHTGDAILTGVVTVAYCTYVSNGQCQGFDYSQIYSVTVRSVVRLHK